MALLVVTIAGSSMIQRPSPRSPALGQAPLIAGSTGLEDAAHRRRRDAKQFNERLKARVNFLNGMAIALFVAVAVTVPGQTGERSWSLTSGLVGLFVAAVVHMLSLRVLRGWKSED